MIERDLAALADRVAPPERPGLPARVLARIDALDGLDAGGHRSPQRARGLVAAALAAVVAASFLSPQVRAFAADLLGVAGIELLTDTPDAPPEPRAPLPGSRGSSLAEARAEVGFRIGVPTQLGPPEQVIVSDDNRVVTMTWRDGDLVLDQFAARLGPVFSKHVGGVASEVLRVGGARAWWISEPHDLTYVDREGRELTATARLAGPSLVWEAAGDVTVRLEGSRLARDRAVQIARSYR